MMRLLVLAGLVASSVGCIESEAPIKLLFARPLEEDGGACKASTDFQTSGGSLDLSGSLGYSIGFDLESNLESTVTAVEDDTLSTAERNDFFLSSMTLEYQVTPSTFSLASEEIAMYGVVRAGATEPTAFIVNLIGPKAAEKLAAQIVPGTSVELLVTIRFKGKVGSGKEYETNPGAFPITIYNSGFTDCETGKVLVRVPCLPVGQDIAIACEDKTAP